MPFSRLRQLIILVCLLVLTLAATLTPFAQDPPPPQDTPEVEPTQNRSRGTPEPTFEGDATLEPRPRGRVHMEVEEMTVSANADTNMLLVTLRGTNYNGCDLPPEVKTQLISNALYIDFEPAEGSPANIQCITGTIPFTVEVSVPVNQIDLRGKDEMYVITETYLAQIPVSRVDTAVGSIPVVTFGEPEQYFRVNVNITAARFQRADAVAGDAPVSTEDNGESQTAEDAPENGVDQPAVSESEYVIAYTGTVDGCVAPVLSRVVDADEDHGEDKENGDEQASTFRQIVVEVFRPLPVGIMCPRNIVQIEGTIPAPDDIEGIVAVLVNDFVFTADPEVQTGAMSRPPRDFNAQADNLARNPLTIEQINMLVTNEDPMLVRLELSGTYGDGCPLELETDVNIEGQLINVTAYRIIDPAMMCPMVISNYNEIIEIGELPAGLYQLNINGTTTELDLSGG